MIFLFSILISLSFLHSQYDWQDNGVAVRQGIHIEWQRTGDNGNDGEMIFAWSDTRYGGRDIYAKKIDKDGNYLWSSEGVPIVIADGRQEDPILVSDDNGGAYIIWVDYRDEPENGDIYAQHINSEGIISWDIQGVPLTTVPGKQVSPNMSKDGIGGAFVIWNDKSVSTLGYIYGTHLTTDLNDIINPGIGVPLISSDSQHSGVSIEVASEGSAIMVWADDKNIEDTDLDIYGQRIDVNCNTLWSTPEEGGIPICNFDNIQQYVKVTYYNESHSVVVWEDRRNNANAGDVYAQFVSMDGEIDDLSGIPICVDDFVQIKPRVKASPFGAHIVWEDKRNMISDIYAQLLTIDGGVQWQDNGIAVCSANGAQDQPRLTTDNSGGAYYVWMDERYNSFPETEIFLQYLDTEGNSAFENNGISISSAPQYQFNPLVRSDGLDGALVVWGDMRSGSIGLYAQHVSKIDGSASFEIDGVEYYFGIDGNGLQAKSLYLGSDEALLYWEDHRLGVISDLTYGQKVFSGWEDIQEPNGLKLSNNPYQTNPKAERLGDEVFLGFAQADGDLQIFYQILDEELNIEGDANGSPVFNSGTPHSNFDITHTSENNLFLAFSDTRNFIDKDIYLSKYNASGTSLFAEPVLIIDNFFIDDEIIFVSELSNTNILIGYDSGSSSTGIRSYVITTDSDGNILNTGIRLSSDENDQFIKGHAVSNDKTLIIWKDQRSGNSDIYGQILNHSGDVLLSPDGVAIGSGDNDQQAPTITYNSIKDEFMVCWESFTGIDFNIICRTIDNQTLELSDDILLCDDPSNQKSPYVFATLDGSYLFSWEDSRASVTSDIYFQQRTNNQFLYVQNGIVLCDADFNQKNPQIDLYDEMNNSYLIFWDDLRSSGKEDLTNIYSQSVTVSSGPICNVGDINGDGLLNVIDVVNLVNYLVGSGEFDATQLCAADLNQDNVINVLDVVNLINLILSF